MPEHAFGWRKDSLDARDHLYLSPYLPSLALPARVDLRATGFMPAVEDQGQLGSCTSFGIAGAVMFDRAKQGLPTFTPSHLFVYYGERVIEHSVASDAGAEIRDGMTVINKSGVCPEADWPYDVSKFAHKPPTRAYADAKQHKAISYQRVAQDEAQMKGCLASGYPIVVGISVYASFESAAVAKSGAVPMPKRGEQLLGGHCVLLVGYDDAADTWLLRNSWGPGWAQAGYFTLPTRYLLTASLASDFWTVRAISG
jgi:C1A family cysteine protease